MTPFLLLIVCAGLGMIAARTVKGAAGFTPSLNWWVLNIALPALVLELLPKLKLSFDLWFLLVSQWLIFAGGWAVFAFLGRQLRWSGGRVAALTLTAGLCNALFIGYPVIEAVLGRAAMPYAVMADQGGSFIAFLVGGALVMAVYGERAADAPVSLTRLVGSRLLTFPALYALVVGVAVGQIGGWPPDLDALLLRIGGTLTPIALFSAGLQFRFGVDGDQRAPLLLGLSWKLVLAPLLVFALGAAAGISGSILSVGVLQAAMPPMISGAILADQNGFDPPLANAVLALGILLSVVTVTMTAFLL